MRFFHNVQEKWRQNRGCSLQCMKLHRPISALAWRYSRLLEKTSEINLGQNGNVIIWAWLSLCVKQTSGEGTGTDVFSYHGPNKPSPARGETRRGAQTLTGVEAAPCEITGVFKWSTCPLGCGWVSTKAWFDPHCAGVLKCPETRYRNTHIKRLIDP